MIQIIKNQLRLYLIIIATLYTFCVHAQVTIGSNYFPVSGALLDLKENADGSSNKGLGLPKVRLVTINKLLPMFENDIEYVDGSQYKANQDAVHTGLLVFNITTQNDLKTGIYVWNGKLWDEVLIVEEDKSPYIDQDGNPFKAVHIKGKDATGLHNLDAGIWMTENLRAKKYDPVRTGDDKNNVLGDMPSVAAVDLYGGRTWCYPSLTNQSSLVSDIYDLNYSKNLPIGLFYNWYAATNKTDDADGTLRIQGICPKHWHLPSEAECKLLDQVMSYNPSLYSTNDNDHVATTIKAPDRLYVNNTEQVNVDPIGKSFSYQNGGFYILLIGLGVNGYGFNFGYEAYFWTSTEELPGNDDSPVYVRQVDTTTHPTTGKQSKAEYFSVRCKKDT